MKLQQRFSQVRKRKGLEDSTEQAYWGWCRRFIDYHRAQAGRWVYPAEWDESHVEKFLTHLAVEKLLSRELVPHRAQRRRA